MKKSSVISAEHYYLYCILKIAPKINKLSPSDQSHSYIKECNFFFKKMKKRRKKCHWTSSKLYFNILCFKFFKMLENKT